MSDAPQSDWTPIHHTDGEEPETGSKPAKTKPEGKTDGKSVQSPVSLTLNLPDEFTAALKEYAKALNENTKAIRDLLKGPSNDTDNNAG